MKRRLMKHTSTVIYTFLALLAGCTSSSPAIDVPAELIRGSACRSQSLSGLSAEIVRQVENAGGSVPAGRVGACGSSATCADYLACIGIDTGTSCSGTPTRCADATHLVVCADGFEQTIDCAANPFENTSCVSTASATTCGGGTCDTAGRSCEGNVLVDCAGGITQRTDCAAFGRTCVAAAGQGACVHVAESCTADRCDGRHLLDCDGSGLGLVRLDCAIMAGPTGTCEAERGCIAATPECEAGTAECQGSVARFCLNGAWEPFDCSAIEGATCRAGEVGFFGQELECVIE